MHIFVFFYFHFLLMGLYSFFFNRREFLLSEAADTERAKVIRQREESERLLRMVLKLSRARSVVFFILLFTFYFF